MDNRENDGSATSSETPATSKTPEALKGLKTRWIVVNGLYLLVKRGEIERCKECGGVFEYERAAVAPKPRCKCQGDRFFLDRDDDGHWFLVPADKSSEWEEWRDIPSDDERSWNHPEWAKPIDGPRSVTFTSPKE